MVTEYTIVDIKHTGSKGSKRGEPKVGEKYDARRGRRVFFDPALLKKDCSAVLTSADGSGALVTTPFVRMTVSKDSTELETQNSIYELSIED